MLSLSLLSLFYRFLSSNTAKMSDSEFSLNDYDSNDELFTDEIIQDDNDSSEGEDNFSSHDTNVLPLKLEVGLSFPTWKAAFRYVKQWAYQQGFFIRKGRSEKEQSNLKKQTIVCRCEGLI